MHEKLKERFGATTISLFLTMVLVFLFMYALNGRKFIDRHNLTSMTYQLPIIGLLAVGMMFTMLTRYINLSIVANANLNGLIIWLVLDRFTAGSPGQMRDAAVWQVAVAIACGLGVSIMLGIFHGLMVAWLRIPALLCTLGTMTFITGVNEAVSRGYTISGFPASLTGIGNGRFSLFGLMDVPIPIVIFMASVLVAYYLLRHTRLGFSIYMIGANETAARFSGINVVKVNIIQYVISAIFASLTSIIMIGQLNSIKANYYESYVLVAVLSCFLGGVDPKGGFGHLSGVVIATIILQFMSSGLTLMRLDPFMITIMWGGIVILLIFGRAFMNHLRLALRRRAGRTGAD
ncbi:MAG: ABC transporter permease [Planctomycetes bacterium]|nr:ABC transporter permease [Planctomycetota bacterium]